MGRPFSRLRPPGSPGGIRPPGQSGSLRPPQPMRIATGSSWWRRPTPRSTVQPPPPSAAQQRPMTPPTTHTAHEHRHRTRPRPAWLSSPGVESVLALPSRLTSRHDNAFFYVVATLIVAVVLAVAGLTDVLEDSALRGPQRGEVPDSCPTR